MFDDNFPCAQYFKVFLFYHKGWFGSMEMLKWYLTSVVVHGIERLEQI